MYRRDIRKSIANLLMLEFFKIGFVHNRDIFILLYLKDILNQKPNTS